MAEYRIQTPGGGRVRSPNVVGGAPIVQPATVPPAPVTPNMIWLIAANGVIESTTLVGARARLNTDNDTVQVVNPPNPPSNVFIQDTQWTINFPAGGGQFNSTVNIGERFWQIGFGIIFAAPLQDEQEPPVFTFIPA